MDDILKIKQYIIQHIKTNVYYNYEVAIALRDLFIYIAEEIEHSKKYDVIEIIEFLDDFKKQTIKSEV